MKTIATVKALTLLMLAASLTARAQGERQRPSPEQMAKHMMEKFDANKDADLEQAERTQALEFSGARFLIERCM